VTLLKLDFDGRIPRGFLYRLRHCMHLWRWKVEGVRYDRTRRGWHVLVGIRQAITPPLVVAAQAVLGSDPARESYNLMRVQRPRRGFFRDRWNVLYKSHSRGVTLDRTEALG
jgi:hypothetical protein